MSGTAVPPARRRRPGATETPGTEPVRRWRPDYAIAPGVLLREQLAALGITQAELALRTGLSPKHVNQVIKGLVSLSPDVALLLERVLDTPSYVWNELEAAHRDVAVRAEARTKLQAHSWWADRFPVADLINNGILAKGDDAPSRVEKLLSFFGVADPDAYDKVWREPVAVFRRSQQYEVDVDATAAWLRLTEIEAGNLELADYDSKAFRRLLPELRALTIPPLSESFSVLQSRCASVGVAVVRVRPLTGTRACGATRWISTDYPIIVLSGRYRMEDSLWFSFFHESGHIVLHPRRATYIALDRDGDDGQERQADEFARDLLIPPDDVGRLATLTTARDIEQFAKSSGVHPGIVTGRLMKEERISWSSHAKLRRKLTD